MHNGTSHPKKKKESFADTFNKATAIVKLNIKWEDAVTTNRTIDIDGGSVLRVGNNRPCKRSTLRFQLTGSSRYMSCFEKLYGNCFCLNRIFSEFKTTVFVVVFSSSSSFSSSFFK